MEDEIPGEAQSVHSLQIKPMTNKATPQHKKILVRRLPRSSALEIVMEIFVGERDPLVLQILRHCFTDNPIAIFPRMHVSGGLCIELLSSRLFQGRERIQMRNPRADETRVESSSQIARLQ